MCKIIAISNPKGGVGKTTTTVNLAASLAIAEQKVLILDIDPANSVSISLGIHQEDIKAGIFELFSGSVSLPDAILPTDLTNLDVIPTNVYNNEQEMRLLEMAKNRIRLKLQLDGLLSANRLNYDYILIDTPPSVNDLTVGALLAADSVLIPFQVGNYALKAIERLLRMIVRIRKSANQNLKIEGVVINFYEKGTRLSRHSATVAGKYFGNLLFKTVIPKNTAIGYATFERKPVALFDINAIGAQAYLSLAEEVIHKNRIDSLIKYSASQDSDIESLAV